MASPRRLIPSSRDCSTADFRGRLLCPSSFFRPSSTARFSFPRQNKEGGLCIADFFRDVAEGARDVIALQVVTMGQRASEAAREWFAENRYQDYLYLHGLSVEMAEAMAEYVHKRIRAELGFAGEDDRDMDKMLAQAMPTPVMESNRSHLLWMIATESRPTAPHSRQTV